FQETLGLCYVLSLVLPVAWLLHKPVCSVGYVLEDRGYWSGYCASSFRKEVEELLPVCGKADCLTYPHVLERLELHIESEVIEADGRNVEHLYARVFLLNGLSCAV